MTAVFSSYVLYLAVSCVLIKLIYMSSTTMRNDHSTILLKRYKSAWIIFCQQAADRVRCRASFSLLSVYPVEGDFILKGFLSKA